ncbi:YebC/PmpR family DNA-binding transcriptional regulator [Kroppenstedtia eburnea]|uniref:Probable transcriptional regulatory protein SAMN05421790_105226 n=1 Tax=Kroppenstedtia eburnea TaxID=714067 RepID=A0A1N7M664_9BACL|nr:YebC/PmpR family DNA-binding transcriptional regulator [Kroppenstedtia eburnea]QKI81848.1 YebC/PmpR family DNA-binding transcriptional regulator [Kroppenstedtia eburnea]SIS81532.1 DNA-binding regulatory protein, YebC/PmpR family [Kroppenstedtia eburnea]
MAGHSKWKNIQHRKGRQDALRGKLFAKLAREISVAAREGGGDPDQNQRLRLAISKARSQNMPNDNIERAIHRGTGAEGGSNYEAVTYEGYGPGGAAVMAEALTDNRNRTAADVRHIFSKRGGSMGEAGCVAWMFDKKGLLRIDREAGQDEDEMMLQVLEAGAEDFEASEDAFEITTSPDQFEEVKASLEGEGFHFSTAEVTMVPQNTVTLTGDQVTQMLQLLEALEDHDDIQNVYANVEIDDGELGNHG